MIINIISVLFMMFSFWTIGNFFVHKILKLSEKFSYINMIVGYSLVAVITSFLYIRIGFSIKIISGILSTLSIIIYILQIKHIQKKEYFQFAIQILLFFLLIIPGLLHGDQYYVYRGNFFDQYIYLSEGLTAYKFSWQDVLTMNTSSNDVFSFGVDLLKTVRPPITLVYSLLLTGMKGNMFFLAYLYHIMFLSMIFVPMYELVKHITDNAYVATIVTVLYIGGFFGQIQFDINAWSHLGTIALFIANAHIVMQYFEDAYLNRENIQNGKKYVCNIKILILMNIVMVGGILYYVEDWLVQYGLSCAAILLMCIIKKYKVNIKQIGSILSVPIVSLITSFIVCPQIIDFLQQQVTSSIDSKVDYGPYWYNWLFGFWYRDNIPAIAKVPAIFTSMFGASVYVPDWDRRRLIVYVWTFLFAGIAVALLVNLLYRLYEVYKSENIGEQFISIWFLVSVVVGVVLYFKSGRYAFTKYILYVSPFLWIVATISIKDFLCKEKRNIISFISFISAISILFSGVALMGFRVKDTLKNDKCFGYVNSYPSDQDLGLKASHIFNLDLNKAKNAQIVQIEEEFPFYLYYMKLSLLYSGKEYYSSENHVFYVNDDVPMDKPDHIDALITLEENADGRMEPVYR